MSTQNMTEAISAKDLQPGLVRHGLTLLRRAEGTKKPSWVVRCGTLAMHESEVRSDVLASAKPTNCPGCKLQKSNSKAPTTKTGPQGPRFVPGQLLPGGKYLIQSEAPRDAQGNQYWVVSCTTCGHTRTTRPSRIDPEMRCPSCKPPVHRRKPAAARTGRFDAGGLLLYSDAYLWWLLNLRPVETYPQAWRDDFDQYFAEALNGQPIHPHLDRTTGAEIVSLARVDPNLPWSSKNARIAPVRGRADPEAFVRTNVRTDTLTKDGLVIYSWSPPGVKVYLPDDQWVDPDPARDHPNQNFEELLRNSDKT